MKNISIKLFIVVVLAGIFSVSCTKDFADLNKDPNQVNDPDLSQLLTNALYNTAGDEYLQWFYNNSVYFWRFQQITVSLNGTSSDFNQVGALGTVPLYRVMIDMKEIRNRIDKMSDTEKAKYKALKAITYIPQVFLGLRMSDWQGSMVYSQAVEARYSGNITPKYDSQKELFTIWLSELDEAISVLTSTDATQITPGNQDFIFQGDWVKWARFANTLKLRIASRLENADPTWMKTILSSVLSKKDANGNLLLITEPAQQAIWASGSSELGPGGTNSLWVENYAPSQNFSAFLRKNQDPRLGIFFRKNALDDLAISKLKATPGVTLPAFATTPVNDPWDRLIGGPVAPDQSGIKDFFGAALKDTANKVYNRLPFVEYNLIKPKQDNRKGEYLDFLLGVPEVCFYLAEFIEKGYISGIGTAKDWYEKGIKQSCTNYNVRAQKAQIPDYATRSITDSQINALLSNSDIKYMDGDQGNVEKIILQQLINLFDNPSEGVAVTRRTGYPKRTSSIWAWQPYNAGGVELKLARRFPWATPGDATNKTNWQSALTEQGFTADKIEGEVLNQERVWWDKTSPDYGNGK